MDPVVGTGKYTYRVNENWMKPPAHIEVRACAVSVDSQDRVYCFNRNAEYPVVIFDRDGNFLSSWGQKRRFISTTKVTRLAKVDVLIIAPPDYFRAQRTPHPRHSIYTASHCSSVPLSPKTT